MTDKQIFSLYYHAPPKQVETLDVCHGDSDFRRVHITYDSLIKLAIKQTSNTFTDSERIAAWSRLINEYNKLGIYCPKIIPNCNGKEVFEYTEDGRVYHVYAEEFAKYDTAKHIITDKLKDENGRPYYVDNMLRSVGKVASAHFDFMNFHSAYCLLEPHSAPDTTDEGTETALRFCNYIKENIPAFYPRVQELLEIFYRNQKALREIYHTLPVSCFQADLNDSNVLLDEKGDFAGLIDFNLSGKEPVLNYTVRAAMWQIFDKRLHDEEDSRLYWYDEKLNDVRMNEFMRNIRCIEEHYTYSEAERRAFPVLFRYMNSFWWHHVWEIERIKDNSEKIDMLLCWLEHQMTRDDIKLP